MVLVLAIGTLVGSSEPAHASHPLPTATVVQSNLEAPWDLGFAPDGRMFVTERPGRIRVYASGMPGAALLSTTSIPFIRAEHESGANGIAVDRDFAANPYVYVCAARDLDGTGSAEPWINQLLRYRVNANGTLEPPTLVPGIAAVANTQHNGCSVEMDASGLLWIGIGDGAVGARAQDPESLNGKILRINRDGSIPADNPILPGATGRTAVFSMGHRNPQGIAFSPGGEVYAVEHGPGVDDEINRITAGGNYGWPCYTGAASPNPNTLECGLASIYVAPVWASGAPTIATSGMTFLNHPTWASWSGSAITAQLKDQDLRRFVPASGGQTMQEVDRFLDGRYGRLRAAVQAPDGALYVTTSSGTGDRVLRIVPGDIPVDRLAGADRYATAAQISANTFAPGVPTVYVATGANYPDALAGGAAAARDRGPVLLVTHGTVPAATAAELARLRPNRIIVLGGTGVVSAAVQQELGAYAPGGTVRLAGADRYATAAAISRSTFAPNAPVAYIATGQNYPDALAGVPAAGVGGGPILLVNRNGIPRPTVLELERLQPQRIVVLGGTGPIPNKVVTSLQAYTSSAVERRSGDDRYSTAVATSVAAFGPGVDRVFIATGLNFPDGLAGGPAGSYHRGPLLLVPGTSLPASVRAELQRLDPDHVTLLGGPAVLSDGIAAEISELLNP